MEFSSNREVLEFALSKEEASVQFYRDLAAQMSEPTTRSLFEALIKNEKQHVESLRLELEKLGFTVDTSHSEPSAEFQWQERLEIDDTSRGMSFVDGLMLAIQKERAAFRLYTILLGNTRNSQYENILIQLAEEEMRHVLQLEREYESMIHHRD
jgi:rubrerythrin